MSKVTSKTLLLFTVLAVSSIANIWFLFLLMRWWYAAAKASYHVNESLSAMGGARRWQLVGGGMEAHAFLADESGNKDDVAFGIRTFGRYLTLVRTASGREYKMVLQNGSLEAKWIIDGEKCRQLKVVSNGKEILNRSVSDVER